MKGKLSVVIISIMLSCILIGCNSTDKKINELENYISDLEKELNEIKESSEQTQVSANNIQEYTESTNVVYDSEEITGSQISYTYSFDELKSALDTVAAKISEAMPSGPENEQRNQFLELKSELESVENMMDIYESELENAYRTNLIEKKEFRADDKELELLELQLDQIEDTLELLFPIYDD